MCDKYISTPEGVKLIKDTVISKIIPENKAFGNSYFQRNKVAIKQLLWNKAKYFIETTEEWKCNCPLCMLPFNFDECNIDHIIPKSKGGRHIMSNLQLTHFHCNYNKGQKYTDEIWL